MNVHTGFNTSHANITFLWSAIELVDFDVDFSILNYCQADAWIQLSISMDE
jgi:hypothetical protein